MSNQSLFEQLATHCIPANGTAGSVVSQKGCRKDEELTPREQMENLKRACRRMESIVGGIEKGHPKRRPAIEHLESIKAQMVALRKQYPKELRKKNNVFDKLLINELKLKVTDYEFGVAYRNAERQFEQGEEA